ncbi:MAG: helix-turn-helix transcriptional regulator [Deltaproteobacteria bacterium]|nr:helix-turn-helix transcriptional regulator [Deltaproteobacteria bacterium]
MGDPSQRAYGSRLLKEVAEDYQTSTRTLQRRFAAKGVRFRDLRNDAQTNTAKQLLLIGRYTVREVAAQLGYATSSSFCRAFKRNAGCTPREYVTNAAARPDGSGAQPELDNS